MAFKLPTMTRETSSSTLTGDMVMGGAQTGYYAFSAGLSNGDTTFLTFKMGSDEESGKYTYNSGANSFTRTSIYRSTNGNAAVSWAAGTKDVICGLPGLSDVPAADLDLFMSLTNMNHSGCGRLTASSTTQLKFAPYKGDKIKIAGVWYSIPSAGITASNSSTFLNGTGASALIGSTVYLVCLFNNSGTIAIDFLSTLTHAADTAAGNVGVEIKNGDNTRSVIGLIRTDASGSAHFADSATQRFILSWFNPRPQAMANNFTATRTTTSATAVEINTEIRCEFLCWATDAVNVNVQGYASNSSAGAGYTVQVGIDAAAVGGELRADIATAGAAVPFNVSYAAALSEGYHTVTLMGRQAGGAGTVTWDTNSYVRGWLST